MWASSVPSQDVLTLIRIARAALEYEDASEAHLADWTTEGSARMHKAKRELREALTAVVRK